MKKRSWSLGTVVVACVVSGILGSLSAMAEAKGKPSVEERIEELLSAMTLEEKVALVSGETSNSLQGYPRLGIGSLKVTDGPHGVGWGVRSTCFPTCIAMASTWNGKLIERVGAALARETRSVGRHILLGPCVNIHRTPLGGRNFESFGEDPYLAARMSVAYVKGLQGEGIGASTKHYAVNNQEVNRMHIDARVDERTLREIYLPAFKASVLEADTWTIMAAYNKVDGKYCCASEHLLDDILKKEWGFKGFVVSDWGACHSTVPCANAGLDLEMDADGPNLRQFFKKPLLDAVKNGEVAEEVLEDKVRRILGICARVGIIEGLEAPKGKSALATPEHIAIAREVAQEAMVLLKNEDNILPLSRGELKSVAVIGPNATEARLGGGGSSTVFPPYAVSPIDGIRTALGEDVRVEFAVGCKTLGDLAAIPSTALRPPEGQDGEGLFAEYFDNMDLAGDPVVTRMESAIDFNWRDGSPAPELPSDKFSARWTGKLVPVESGTYDLGVKSDDGSRIYLDGKLVVDHWSWHSADLRYISIDLEAGREYELRVEYFDAVYGAEIKVGWEMRSNLQHEAVELASQSDAAIVVVGLSDRFEGEGRDRETMDLPGSQAELIRAVAEANEKTVVVLVNGSPVKIDDWIDAAPAVLEAWYPGQEGGHAMADVLFGDVNPSGKLPMTLAKRIEDYPSHGNYPGDGITVNYAEGILVGYRHFDTRSVEPQFPFGHGLSYTTFEYKNLKVTPQSGPAEAGLTVDLTIRNSGERQGKEVVQLYVADVESSLERPVKELKGFQKVSLRPGEERNVIFELNKSDLSFYDPERKQWVAEPGMFEILVGSSSRDIRLRDTFELSAQH